MRVILHIGCEKTGTSTIQRFLHDNKDILRQRGLLFPITPLGPDFPSHVKLSAFARRKERPDDVRERLGIVDLPKFQAQTRQQLYRECKRAGCHTIIISSEHLSSRLNYEDEIIVLKRLIDGIGPAKIVLYLRRQDEALVSAYATRVRLGSTEPFSLPDDALFSELYDYQRMCTIWANCFGKDAIDVRIFSREEMRSNRLLIDFASAAGIPRALDAFIIGPPENESMIGIHVEFLRRFNAYLPHMSTETRARPNPAQGDLLEIMQRLERTGSYKREMFNAPRDMLDRFMDRCAAGNAFVARTFLNRTDGNLFSTPTTISPDEGNKEFTIDVAFQIFANIWREKVLQSKSVASTREFLPTVQSRID